MIRARLLCSVMLVSCLTLGAASCDKKAPEEPAAPEVDAWTKATQELDAKLAATDDDDDKRALLKAFIDANNADARIGQYQKQLEELQPKAVDFGKAFDEKELDASGLGRFFVSYFAKATQNKNLGEPLEAPIDLVMPDGATRTFDKEATIGIRWARGFVRLGLKDQRDDLIGKKCGQQCVSDALNALLEPKFGKLVTEPGVVDAAVAGKLAEAVWIAPDDEIGGVKASQYYRVFRPTVRHLAAANRAVVATDPNNFVADFVKVRNAGDAKATSEWYRKFIADKKLADALGGDDKAVFGAVSFWVRRYADGSAPAIAGLLDKVVAAYDPEYAGE